jgi:hypothetical protein
MRISSRVICVIAAAVAASVVACGEDKPGPAPGSVRTLEVLIDAPTQSVVIGQQPAQARARSRNSDGTITDVSFVTSWSSSNPSVLSVSSTGTFSGVNAGTAEIVATYSGITGRLGINVLPVPADDQRFRVAIMLTTGSRPLESDVMRVFAKANDLLLQKTGERMERVDFFDAGPGNVSSLAQAYLQRQTTSVPDGILALSDDATATSLGGYSFTLALPSPFQNRFPTPSSSTREYVAVVDFVHKYARCGYDDAGNRVSATSFGGECRNQTGLQCVDNGKYWQCPDTLSDLYSEPDRFPACTFVHEFLHPFGTQGNNDHYGTAECTARTGMTPAQAQDRRLFQESCGMCPDLYPKFRHR